MMTEETKQTEVIKLNNKTKSVLIGINQTINNLHRESQLVIQTYLDALDKEGDYQLSSDMGMLIKKESE